MVASIELCAEPNSSLAALRDLCSWADELHLAYAWITSARGASEHWRALPLAKLRRAVVGTQFAQTEPAALRALLDIGGGALRVIEDTGGVFHPKVIVGTKGDRARALLGSSNFTHGGFGGNTELNVVLEGDVREGVVAEALSFIEQQWRHPRAFVPDAEWLDRYAKAYAARPRPQQLPGPPPRVLLTTAADLDIGWADYFRLIEKQERRMLSTGTEIHVFDHPDASYLQEIETCQGYFAQSTSFSTMPVEQRKFVAGFGDTSGYFGRMVGAGNFKNMIIQRPEEIGLLLDTIPAIGMPTDRQVTDYLDGATVVRGVSIATATRLLVAKRPDIFLSVNRASGARIRELFGSVPARAVQYVALMKRLWALPWFNSPEPKDVHQRRIWRVRVAILDAVMYEPTTGSGPSASVNRNWSAPA